MARCRACDGTGYENNVHRCRACNGTGFNGESIESHKTNKGFIELGLIGGVFIGFYGYLITLDYNSAIFAGVMGAMIIAMILRFIGKYFIIILVLCYVLYLLFG